MPRSVLKTRFPRLSTFLFSRRLARSKGRATAIASVLGATTILAGLPLSSAQAANECGTMTPGGTVTCNGDGTPFLNGITYTTPGTLVLDGTDTPLVISNGVHFETNGDRAIEILGQVDITTILTSGSTLYGLGTVNNGSPGSTQITIGEDASVTIVKEATANRHISYGVTAFSSGGYSLIESAGDVTVISKVAVDYIIGVVSRLTGGVDGSSTIITTGGTIDVSGIGAYFISGLYAFGERFGEALIDNAADIFLSNSGAAGICNAAISYSTDGIATVVNSGNVQVDGSCSSGQALSAFASETATVSTQGSVLATAMNVTGVEAGSTEENAIVLIDGTTVSGGGGTGVGVSVSAATGATIDVVNGSALGALSDLAILTRNTSNIATSIVIDATSAMTGYVTLGGDNVSIENAGLWNVRNWADTTGDQIRDTAGVAINEFGDGEDSLLNTGAILLSTVASGNGIEEAQFLGLETFTNQGHLSMADAETGGTMAVAGDKITLDGDYVGGDGSLSLDTFLGDDNSATDLLVVNGDSTGVTTVNVTNTGGLGAATNDGILVVDVLGDTSDAGAFVLYERLFAGIFEYLLTQNSQSDPNDGNWYLLSVFSTPSVVYESAPAILLSGFADMPTLEQRVGQRQWGGRDSDRKGPSEPSRGTWLRVTGERADFAPEHSSTGAFYESDGWGLQVGLDFDPIVRDKGLWVLGVTGQYGITNANVSNGRGLAGLSSEGYGLGATATWYGNNGTYVDLQGQVNWITSDFMTATTGDFASDLSSTAYALSAEVGHRHILNENSALVPQAQLIWGQINGASSVDTLGNLAEFGRNNSLVGRIGLAYEYEYSEGWLFGDRAASSHQSHREKAYVIANVLHDFSAASTVVVDGTSLSASNNATWGEVGIGGSITWNDTTTLYTEGSYRQEFGNSSNDAFSMSVGLRIQW